MPVEKICPRCKSEFLCYHENILLCDCSKVNLSEMERAFIAEQYSDCLCMTCLQELKNCSSSANKNQK